MAPEVEALARRLSHPFRDHQLLVCALTHRSWCAERQGDEPNERLEFLGDAVLGMVVTDHIYRRYPVLAEGELAKVRADVVSTVVLAQVAAGLGLGAAMFLGKGEDNSGGRQKASILADATEALIGAIYLDGGWEAAVEFVLELLGDRIVDAVAGPGDADYKTRLQELAARRFDCLPRYLVLDRGPDHAKHFSATVEVGARIRGTGEGRSKKQAEQAAAAMAWKALEPVGDEVSV